MPSKNSDAIDLQLAARLAANQTSRRRFIGGGAAFYLMYRKITAAQRRDDEERLGQKGPGPSDGQR